MRRQNFLRGWRCAFGTFAFQRLRRYAKPASIGPSCALSLQSLLATFGNSSFRFRQRVEFLRRQSFSRSPSPPSFNVEKDVCQPSNTNAPKKFNIEGGGRRGRVTRGLNNKATGSTYAVERRVKNSTLDSLERSKRVYLHRALPPNTMVASNRRANNVSTPATNNNTLRPDPSNVLQIKR